MIGVFLCVCVCVCAHTRMSFSFFLIFQLLSPQPLPHLNPSAPTSIQMIFQDPSQMMHQLLTNSRPISSSPDEPWLHDTDFEEKKEKTLALVLAAKRKIREEIGELQDKLRTSKDAAARLKTDLAKGVAGRGGESADSIIMEDLG